MSKNVNRNKLLTTKQIKFYCNLEWLSKSKRLRKKAFKILEADSYLDKKDKEWKGANPFL